MNLPSEFSWIDTSDKLFNDTLNLCLDSDRNLFINGRAGTGKSELIKIIASIMPNTVVLSTTGTTAIELCSDKIAAKTLHSFFCLPAVPIFGAHDLRFSGYKLKQILDKAEIIIIDEASMMSNHMFDTICDKIKQLRHNKDIPRMILFGDVMQLPPVIKNEPNVLKFYQDKYDGKKMFFNSYWYPKLNFRICKLRKSYRQKEIEFAERLLEIGFKDHTKETLDYFNQRVMSLPQFEKNYSQFMYMTPTNKIVDKINNDYIRSLTGNGILYKASMSKGYKAKNIDETIEIKVGAQVMCTINGPDALDNGEAYTNGMIGEVMDLNPEYVTIQLLNGKVKHVGKTTIHNYEIELNKFGDITYVPTGWYRQIDCKVAKACTIHKAQGKTMDAGYVALDNWVPEGLTYVALSRMRTLDGLGLNRPLRESDVNVNNEAYEFLTT